MTAVELATLYLTHRFLTGSTKELYLRVARQLDNHAGVPLQELTEDAAAAFISSAMRVKSCSAATWNCRRRVCKALFGFAVKRGLAAQNVFAGLTQARERLTTKVTEDDDLQRAIDVLSRSSRFKPASFWKSLIKTMCLTGMRRSQIVGLIWRDVVLSGKYIAIRAANSKTHKEYRIPMADALIDDLAQLKALAMESWQASVEIDATQVFNEALHRSGTQISASLTPDLVSSFFNTLRRNSGTNISAHKLRHRFATRVAQRLDVRNLQAILGHAQITTTMRYVWPSHDIAAAALNATANELFS